LDKEFDLVGCDTVTEVSQIYTSLVFGAEMEAKQEIKKKQDSYKTSRHRKSEGLTIHGHRRENLESFLGKSKVVHMLT
jgi:hypothetical protein